MVARPPVVPEAALEPNWKSVVGSGFIMISGACNKMELGDSLVTESIFVYSKKCVPFCIDIPQIVVKYSQVKCAKKRRGSLFQQASTQRTAALHIY